MKRAKIHPIVIAAAAAVLVCGALGAAAITGSLPIASSTPGVAAAPAACLECGVVESVKTVAAEAPQDARKSTRYRVSIRMDDGSTRSIALPSAAGYAVGDRVRILRDSRLERV